VGGVRRRGQLGAGGGGESSERRIGATFALWSMVPFAVFGAWRIMSCGLVIDGEMLVIHDFFWHYRIPRTEVEGLAQGFSGIVFDSVLVVPSRPPNGSLNRRKILSIPWSSIEQVHSLLPEISVAE
jgi:hypothetical protein